MPEALLETQFIPADLDCSTFDNLKPYYDQLLDTSLVTAGDLEAWLLNLSDLTAMVYEVRSQLFIAHAAHTEDEEKEKAYFHFVEQVQPKIQPIFFELQKKFLACPSHEQLASDDQRIEMIRREWATDVELFREANIPLFTENTKLSSAYGKLRGKMTVSYRGKEYTLPQAAKFLQNTDRAVREEVWRLSSARQLEDVEPINDIFDKIIKLREQIADNAGHATYRDFVWLDRNRFDYTPGDCHAFADAVEQTCMPLVRQMDEQRRETLNVERLMPWDLAVDPRGRDPLEPFDDDQIEDFVGGVEEIFGALSPDLAADFATLRETNCLDLESRKGKRPGGFQSTLSAQRRPFIFMNAAGLHRDVETLLHEGGHAFHTLAARGEPLVFLRHAPVEFCEVASMSMELLADDHLDAFYDDEDASRAKREHLEGVIRLLPWVATIDQYQHWLYTNPGHSRDERLDAWQQILDRFSSGVVDYSEFAESRRFLWQKQLHLFVYAFYYIEYGIAQLGALQVWLNWRNDPQGAIDAYRRALALGGTRPLPDLFDAANITFDFSSKTVAPLMDAIGAELEKLP